MYFKNLLSTSIIISCFLVSYNLTAQPTTVGMLAHFKLDGSITNLGSATVTGTANNTTYTTNAAGAANKAIQFGNNVNSFIDFVDNGNLDFSGTTNFTICFSFYFNGNTTGGLLDNCLNYGGWGVWLWSTVSGVWNIQFNYRNNSVGSSAATNFTLNQWHHVAAMRNNGTISVYIDGVFRLSAAEGTVAPTYPINMFAGGMGYGGYSPPRYNPFNGNLDEIRIYNRALSAAEVSQLVPYSLPLKMGNFTATKQTSTIQLNWETLSEQNTSHFEVERSADATTFISLGSINCRGNSASKQSYNYTDAQPGAGNNFYRLKLVDADGAFTYSRVIVVKNDNNLMTIQLFPNPSSEVLQVQIPSQRKEMVNISIADATGRIVYRTAMQVMEGNNAISIPVQQYPVGKYYLLVENSNGKTTNSFIKR